MNAIANITVENSELDRIYRRIQMFHQRIPWLVPEHRWTARNRADRKHLKQALLEAATLELMRQ